MTIPNSSVGNIMSRLQGLKNVSGRSRRSVIEEPDYLSDLEQEPSSDVTGTSLPNFSNFLPADQNIPQGDIYEEPTPQSYDVRANTTNPEVEDDSFGSSLRKLGANLFSRFKEGWKPNVSNETRQKMGVKPIAQTPPIETAQVDMKEGLPPVTASEQESTNAIGKAISDYFKPFGSEEIWEGGIRPENQLLRENNKLRMQGINPDEYRQKEAETNQKTQNQLQDKINKASENPGTTAVYGATDIVANQPELNAQFKEFTGIDLNDEIVNQTAQYEKVMDDLDNLNNQEMQGYTEQEKRILQRIQNNEATDMDKFYVGLAVLMPMIVGSLFGKQAALGALSGGAQGFVNVLGNRQKENMENEKLLADIGNKKAENSLKKSEIDLKRLQIPSMVQKNLPKQQNEHLIGKKRVTWTDPKTGEEMEGFKIKPGLVARPEYIKDQEELKEMRKEAQEINMAINPTKEINKLTDDIINITSQLDEKDKGFLGDALRSVINGKSPGLATKTGKMIDYDGRKVNSYVVLEHKLKLLTDAYRQAKGMRALTNTVQDHIDSLFRNPAASFQSYDDTIDQMLYTRDLAQSRLLNTVESAGFAPEFVSEMLQPSSKSVYNNLNTRSGEKEASELLRG